ncbi:MAG: BACON domain-containing protein, partial [Bacteroidales bacterium]
MLYEDDFGKEAPIFSPFPSATEWTRWNKTGAGVASVNYVAKGGEVVVCRTATSSGYVGASANNNMMLDAAGAQFIIQNIDPCALSEMRLSFGTNQPSGILTLSYSIDGVNYTALPFNKDDDRWSLITLEFELPSESTKLFLMFTAQVSLFGVRIDDVKLEGLGTPVPGDASGESPVDTTFFVAPLSLSFLQAGESKNIAVVSSLAWAVSSSADWCTVDKVSGESSSEVLITTTANTSSKARAAVVTITANGESKTVNVEQLG